MIEKLEIKINKLKRKIDPRLVKVGVFMLFGALIIFSLEMSNNFKKQKNSVQDEYNKSMYLAVSYINNVEVDLAKLKLNMQYIFIFKKYNLKLLKLQLLVLPVYQPLKLLQH